MAPISGKTFETLLYRVMKGKTKSCGCFMREKAKITPFKHGLIHDSIYWIWSGMKDRVLNERDWAYKNYGGRGITIFPPWIHDFSLFYDYVSALPHFKEKGYSMDRIDNDGNYEPGNIRWTTDHFQSVNSRKRICNTSGFVGISKKRDKWVSYIYVYNTRHHLGTFKNIIDAVEARNNFIVKNNLIEYKIQEVIKCQP